MRIARRNAALVGGGGPGPEPPPAYWGLGFTAEEPGVIVNMTKTGSPSGVTLETSRDGVTWTAFDANGGTTPITLANVGDRVYFRAGSSGNTGMSDSASAYRNFSFNGSVSASGNIMSLLTQNESDWQTVQMVDYCYFYIFRNCTSLTSAPELPATTLALYCYSGMFRDCTSLTTAPALPATILAPYCYRMMFLDCTSLTTAPALPATTLEDRCYNLMFRGCTSLNSVTVAFTGWNPSAATTNWLQSVASNGTFTCPSALGTGSTITRGISNCPSGWTVVNID